MTTIFIWAHRQHRQRARAFLRPARNLTLQALARNDEKAAALHEIGVTPFIGDLDDARSLPPAFEGVDRLWLTYRSARVRRRTA